MSDVEWKQRAEAAEALVVKLEAALKDAIDGYAEAICYKGDYLVEKHGDREEIARLLNIIEGDGNEDGK